MTSPITFEPEEDEDDRPPVRRELSTTLLIVIAAALLVIAALVVVIIVSRGNSSETKATSIAADTAPAVATLDQLCKRGDQLATDLIALGRCGSQLNAAKSAVAGAPTTTAAPGSPGLTAGDVAQIVKGQIAGYVVTPTQVSALVNQVYTANKPADGKDGPAPTSDQVLAAVQAVCANDRCRGPAGADAPPATGAEILTQVQNYCGDPSGPCIGPKGDTGDTGPIGPQGIPGPACPDGWHDALVSEVGVPPQDIQACVADTPPSSSDSPPPTS
jgi:hypothetical protein